MKAVCFHRRGGPDVLEVTELPDPEPGPGQALVAVRAAALNHLDVWVRRGLPIRMDMPHIGGADFAGVVTRLGPGTQGLEVGDAVVGYPVLARGEVAYPECGDDGPGPVTILGEQRNGAFCESIALPAENLVRKPDALSFEEAAAVPVVFLTAWSMLVERAGLRAGETLLVQGAGSGVGTAAIQIGKLCGARVIACTRPEKLDRVRALGADETIDRVGERIEARVLQLTGRHGADVVFEHVGGRLWEASVASAAYGGRIVTCGATAGRHGRTDLTAVFAKQLTIRGVTLGGRSGLEDVLQRVAEGALRPVVDRVMDLEDCRRAHELLEAGEVLGKIVLRVG